MTGKRDNSEINPPGADVYDLLQQLADSDAALVALKDAQDRTDPPVNSLSPQLLDQIQNTLIQSKELLEKMLSSMQVGTAYLDPQFNYVWVNPAFANQRSCSPEDFVGRSHFEVNPGLDNENQIRAAFEKGEPLFIAAQAVAIPENTETRVWDRSFQPVKGSRGAAGLMYTEHDVTDHIRLSYSKNEEHLIQQELLQAIFEVDPAGLAVLSGPDLIFKFANAKFRSFLPHTHNDPIGQSLFDVWPEEKSFLSFLMAKNTRVDVNHQERVFPDGSTRRFNYHIRPMQWKDEPAFMINMWDTTEDQAAYRNIQAAAAEAQRRAEELNAVISAMSEAVTIFDIKGQPVLVNPATIQAYGFDPITIPREKAIQKLSVRRMNGESVKEHELPSARALKGERVHHEQLVFINSEKREQVILASASPLFNEGRLFGAVTVWTDVTEREELLRQINTERARLSTMIANAPVGIVAIDREGDLLIANSMLAELGGQTSNEKDILLEHQPALLDGTPFYPIDFARDAIGGEAQINQEVVIQKPNGEREYLLLNSAPIVDAKGDVEGAVAIFQEITAQKLAEQNLREANERFALVLKNSPVMVYKTDLDLRYIWVYNPQYGLGEAMIGRRDDELAGADDVKALTAFKRSVLMSRKGDRQEIQMIISGVRMIYDVTAEPLYNELGGIAGLTVAAVDITEQKRVKDEMNKNIARIEVQRHLIRQREMERQQIARDLHDGPLQELIGINYGLREALDIPHRRQRRVKVDEIQDGLQELIQEMRAFCSELRPPALAPFGLEKAIRSHIEIFHAKNPSIQVDLDLSIDQDQLPEEVRMALYRIYQELLNNIVKHAKASSVSIRFNFDNRQAELEVGDNGIGFNVPNDWVETARQGHLGLVGIFERTEAVGGSINILSKPGAGTIVKVIVPALSNLNPKGSDSGS